MDYRRKKLLKRFKECDKKSKKDEKFAIAWAIWKNFRLVYDPYTDDYNDDEYNLNNKNLHHGEEISMYENEEANYTIKFEDLTYYINKHCKNGYENWYIPLPYEYFLPNTFNELLDIIKHLPWCWV